MHIWLYLKKKYEKMTVWQALKKHHLTLLFAPFIKGKNIPVQVFIFLIALVSFGLLAIAFSMQYIGGYAPCAFCIFERWPYGALIVLGTVSLMIKAPKTLRYMIVLMILAIVTNIGLSSYHIAIERKWVSLPSVCHNKTDFKKMNLQDLKKQIKQTKYVPCDRVPLRIFGLSPVEYNFLINLYLCLYLLFVFKIPHRRYN